VDVLRRPKAPLCVRQLLGEDPARAHAEASWKLRVCVCVCVCVSEGLVGRRGVQECCHGDCCSNRCGAAEGLARSDAAHQCGRAFSHLPRLSCAFSLFLSSPLPPDTLSIRPPLTSSSSSSSSSLSVPHPFLCSSFLIGCIGALLQ